MKKVKNWLIYLGLPVAAVAGLTAIWNMTDYLGVRPVLSREFSELKITVGANQQAVLLLRWQLLNQRRETQGLTASELVEFCKISVLLGIKGIGCI